MHLGWNFNQTLGVLPTGLRTLRLDGHQIRGDLPTGLTTLRLGWYFNQALGVLPHTLQSLYLSWEYNQPLTVNSLPAGLQSLEAPLGPGCRRHRRYG